MMQGLCTEQRFMKYLLLFHEVDEASIPWYMTVTAVPHYYKFLMQEAGAKQERLAPQIHFVGK
jgi:hypothetical protein